MLYSFGWAMLIWSRSLSDILMSQSLIPVSRSTFLANVLACTSYPMGAGLRLTFVLACFLLTVLQTVSKFRCRSDPNKSFWIWASAFDFAASYANLNGGFITSAVT